MKIESTPSRIVASLSLFLLLVCRPSLADAQENNKQYLGYHLAVIEIEQSLVKGQYAKALQDYEHLFEQYTFIFLRDYKRATQLAFFLKEEAKAVKWLREGIAAGWKWKDIRKNKWTSALRGSQTWKNLRHDYAALRSDYAAKEMSPVAKQVKEMFAKDQRKAFMALFAFSSKAQDRYAERRFAPHSEEQMKLVLEILRKGSYPGEKLIGNEWRMSTILSHHNSISTAYNRQDTLYAELRPLLQQALGRGEISPFSLALIEDWLLASTRRGEGHTYGFLQAPHDIHLPETNSKRAALGLRSVELRNQLVEVEEKTGIMLYLPGEGWVNGKIEVQE